MKLIKGENFCPRVVEIFPMDDFILKIKFSNNEIRYFDVKKIYNMPCFVQLKQKEIFNTAHVEFGSVAWINDIDYCPDTLYMESYV